VMIRPVGRVGSIEPQIFIARTVAA